MATTAQETRSSLFYGWVIVGATFVLLMIMSGITYSTPVLFRFFEADFAIGRAQAAFLFSCSQLLAFVAGPFAGGLVERDVRLGLVSKEQAKAAYGLDGDD